jgi:hypothetical protein
VRYRFVYFQHGDSAENTVITEKALAPVAAVYMAMLGRLRRSTREEDMASAQSV